MRVLVACEFSGRVRQAFRNAGHDAWSCDLFEDSEDGSPFHVRADAVEMAYLQQWDLMIAHPPCTHLAAFETEIAAVTGVDHAVALSSEPRDDTARHTEVVDGRAHPHR